MPFWDKLFGGKDKGKKPEQRRWGSSLESRISKPDIPTPPIKREIQKFHYVCSGIINSEEYREKGYLEIKEQGGCCPFAAITTSDEAPVGISRKCLDFGFPLSDEYRGNNEEHKGKKYYKCFHNPPV